jgi:hypothetical protein
MRATLISKMQRPKSCGENAKGAGYPQMARRDADLKAGGDFSLGGRFFGALRKSASSADAKMSGADGKMECEIFWLRWRLPGLLPAA